MSNRRNGPGRRGNAVLGFAAVLVIAGHSYLLAPFEDYAWLGPFDGLVRSAGIGVTVLLAGSAATFVRQIAGPRSTLRDSGLALLRRLVTVWTVVALVLVLVLCSRGLDDRDDGLPVTGHMVLRLGGFAWNNFVATSPLSVPTELSSLWVFSIEVRALVVVTLLVLLLRRWRPLLTGVVLALAFGGTVWAWQVGRADGAFAASLDSWAIGSTALWGAGLALLGSTRTFTPATARRLTVLGWAGVLGCVLASGWLPASASYSGLLAVAAISTGITDLAAGVSGVRRSLVRAARSVLEVVGHRWHAIVALCVPVMMIVGRHQPPSDVVTFLLAWLIIVAISILIPEVLVPIARDSGDAIRSRQRVRVRHQETSMIRSS